MSTDLVSIVIPSYNHCDYIQEAIQSVVNQSYPHIELIIIDDGSTDNSLKKISQYLSESIRLYTQSNEGAHAAINRGISLSKGKYISILNSDDVYHPQRIEILVNSAQKHPTRTLFFTSLSIVDEHSLDYNGWRLEHYKDLRKKCKQNIDEDYFLIGNIAYTTSNFFFSKDISTSIGNFFDLRYTHDWNFSLRCLLHNRPYWKDDELLQYRVHASNTISESNDVIPHYIENSYNLSWFLHSTTIQKSQWDLFDTPHINLLLMNESYCPIILNYFLNLLQKDTYHDAAEFLEIIKTDNIYGKIQSLLIKRELNPIALQSPQLTNELLQLFESRNKKIVDMKRLINDKDLAIRKQTEMIDNRDQQIQSLNEQLKDTVDYLAKNILKRIITFAKKLIP